MCFEVSFQFVVVDKLLSTGLTCEFPLSIMHRFCVNGEAVLPVERLSTAVTTVSRASFVLFHVVLQLSFAEECLFTEWTLMTFCLFHPLSFDDILHVIRGSAHFDLPFNFTAF